MQSTGVYWIAYRRSWSKAGLAVNRAMHGKSKNLPGRKSYAQESQWLMKMQTRLVVAEFEALAVPQQQIRTMRSYWRQRQ